MRWTSPTFRGARQHRSRGFTLIEAALASIIVGLGVTSVVGLFAACTKQTRAANQMTTAMMLAANVREAMAGLPFDDPHTGHATFGAEAGETLASYNDIDDFNGPTTGTSLSLNPPIDATRTTIASLSQYTQVISVVPVSPNKLNGNTNDAVPEITRTTNTGAARIRIRILYRPTSTSAASEVYQTSWIKLNN